MRPLTAGQGTPRWPQALGAIGRANTEAVHNGPSHARLPGRRRCCPPFRSVSRMTARGTKGGFGSAPRRRRTRGCAQRWGRRTRRRPGPFATRLAMRLLAMWLGLPPPDGTRAPVSPNGRPSASSRDRETGPTPPLDHRSTCQIMDKKKGGEGKGERLQYL